MKSTLLLIIIGISAFSCKKAGHPEAGFKTDKSGYYFAQPVAFTNTSTGGGPYTWNFGDNATSAEKDPVHVYASPGVYKAKLIIGGSVSTKTITVYAGNAGYVVYNNTGADSIRFTTFFHEKDNTAFEDITDHGKVNKQERSDMAFTYRPVLYLKGQLGTTTFTVAEPYTLTKYDVKVFEVNNDTQVVLDPAAENIHAAFKPMMHKRAQTLLSVLKSTSK